jgi:hypothetical protein
MQFDISAVPVGATITNVEFNGYVNSTYYPFWSVTPVTSDPITATASALYADIAAEASSGYYLYQNESSTYTTGWKTHNLAGSVNTDVSTTRSSSAKFALGIATRDTTTTYYIYFDGYAQTNTPYLRITYTGGGPTPSITVTSGANPLGLGSTTQGTAGTPASYTVAGANLGTNNIVITAPSTSVQVSLSSGSGYAASLNLTPSSGSVATTTIYARITTAAPVGSVSGNITHTSTGATQQNLAVTGNVTTPPPSISVTSSSPLDLGSTIVGNASTPASYTVSGANLGTNDIVITSPNANVELCLTSGGTYTATLNLTPSGGTVATTTIFVRISSAAPVGSVSGSITHTSTGATQQDLPVNGTVTVPPPAIALSGVTPPLNLGSTFQGTAGNAAQYMVTGTNLTADIVITAPTGVEISQTGATGTYSGSQTLTQTGGAASGTIHARIASTAAIGAVSGNITHVSTSATPNLAVSGTVNPTAPDMSVTRGVTAVADSGTDTLANRAFGAPFSLTYTIANGGTAALSLNGAPPVVAAPVTNCTVTVTAQPTPTSVAIAGSVTFTVSCTPTAAGVFSFTISIANNDPVANRNPYNWTGSGTGVTAPLMTVTRGAAIANAGTDAVGSVSTTIPLSLNYTVGNSGTAVLNLNGTPKVTVSGLTNCAVSVTTQPGATVAMAGTTSFVLNVRALGSGALSFTVSIANDDPNQNPYTFTGSGSGAGGLSGGIGSGGGGGGGCSVDSSGSTMVWFALLALFAALSLAARRAKA